MCFISTPPWNFQVCILRMNGRYENHIYLSVPCHYIYLRWILHPTLGLKSIWYLIISLHIMDIDFEFSIKLIHDKRPHYYSIILYKSCNVVNVISCLDKLKNQAVEIIKGIFIILHKFFSYYWRSITNTNWRSFWEVCMLW